MLLEWWVGKEGRGRCPGAEVGTEMTVVSDLTLTVVVSRARHRGMSSGGGQEFVQRSGAHMKAVWESGMVSKACWPRRRSLSPWKSTPMCFGCRSLCRWLPRWGEVLWTRGEDERDVAVVQPGGPVWQQTLQRGLVSSAR